MTQKIAEIPDALRRRGLWARFRDRLYGYDFFISYRWGDGSAYARALGLRLKAKGYVCCLDAEEFEPGGNWATMDQLAIRRTARLILVASPEAMADPRRRAGSADPIFYELELFRNSNRHRVRIEFPGHNQEAWQMSQISGFFEANDLYIRENSALHDSPSDAVIAELERVCALQIKRRRQILRIQLSAVVLLAALGAAVFGIWMRHLAKLNEDRANEETERAVDARLMSNASLMVERRDFGRALHVLDAVKRPDAWLTWRLMAWRVIAQSPRFTAGGPTDGVRNAMWSPDGSRLIIVTKRAIVIRNADGTGKPVRFPSSANVHEHTMVWSPDSKHIAVPAGERRSEGDELLIWSSDGRDTRRLETKSAGRDALTWSPDSKSIAIRGDGLDVPSTVTVWQPSSNTSPTRFGSDVETVSWSPNSRYLAVLSSDATAVWDRSTGAVTSALGPVSSLRWLLNGERIMAETNDGTVTFDPSKDVPPTLLPFKRPEVNATGDYLLATIKKGSSDEDVLLVRDLRDGTDGELIGIPDAPIDDYYWSPTGSRGVILDNQGKLYFFEAETRMVVKSVPLGESGAGALRSGSNALWSHGEQKLLVDVGEGRYMVLQPEEPLPGGPSPRIATNMEQDMSDQSLSWSPDDRYVLNVNEYTSDFWGAQGSWSVDGEWSWVPGSDGSIHSYDGGTRDIRLMSPDGRVARKISLAHGAFLDVMQWNQRGDLAVWGGGQATVFARPHDPAVAVPVALVGHEESINGAVWSHDSKRVITSSSDHRSIVWRVDSGEQILEVDTGSEVYAGEWKHDDAQFLTSSKDGVVRVWRDDGRNAIMLASLASLVPESVELFGVSTPFTSEAAQAFNYVSFGAKAAWNPVGDEIMVAGDFGHARLWTPGSDRAPSNLADDKGALAPVSYFQWNPDGERAVMIGDAGAVWVWNRGGVSRGLAAPNTRLAAWSPDGSRLLTLSTTDVWLWDDQFRGVKLMDKESRPVWSRDGLHVADGNGDGLVVMDINDRVSRSSTVEWLFRVAWHPKEQYIAANSQSAVYVWSVPDAGEIGQPITLDLARDETVELPSRPSRNVQSVSWSPDGKWLMVHFDDAVQIWPWDIELLKTKMRGLNTDCLTARMRVEWLLEEKSVAELNHARCVQYVETVL